jgi:hypothetical protein
MDVQIQHNFDTVIRGMLVKAKDFRQPLTDFYGWMIRRTQLTFSKLGKRNNTTPFREMIWKWFAIQYTRKDGTIVPAEGGVAKASGKGVVKGRLRHGPKMNNRVTARSMMMQNNRTMAQAALSRLRMGTDYLIAQTPVPYSKYQQAMRPFAFLVQEDVEFLRKQIIKHLTTP